MIVKRKNLLFIHPSDHILSAAIDGAVHGLDPITGNPYGICAHCTRRLEEILLKPEDTPAGNLSLLIG